MRIEAAADPLATVANHTIALDMTPNACVEVAHRLLGMVAGLSRCVAPNRLRRVEAACFTRIGRAAHGDAETLMATEAEVLLLVAALASLSCHARFDRVHRDVVVRVDGAWAHSAIVTIGAEVFFVAVRAKLRIVRGDHLVPLDEIGRVLRVVHPARRLHLARREHGFEARAVRAALDMTRFACALCIPLRCGVAHLMAIEAAAHARELIARCHFKLPHFTVALFARDVSIGVLLVVERHVGAGDHQARNHVAVALFVPEVAEAALARFVVPLRDFGKIGVIGAVARVARFAVGNERVVYRFARQRALVTRLALRSLRDMKLVVEAERHLLRREHRGARPCIRPKTPRRKPFGICVRLFASTICLCPSAVPRTY